MPERKLEIVIDPGSMEGYIVYDGAGQWVSPDVSSPEKAAEIEAKTPTVKGVLSRLGRPRSLNGRYSSK